MSWVEETLINAFCGARDAAALDAAQMGALSTGSTAAAAEAACPRHTVWMSARTYWRGTPWSWSAFRVSLAS